MWLKVGEKLFDTQTIFSLNLSDIEVLCKLKQARHLADDNLFERLRVKDQQLKEGNMISR